MSGENKTTVRVQIFNQTYTLRAVGDPQEIVDAARNVDELMRSIAQHTGSPDATRAAVLACLHLADQLKINQNETEAVRRRVCERAAELGEMLDKA
jgi:cell division protein ZapA